MTLKKTGMVLATLSVLTFGALENAKADGATIIDEFGCNLLGADSGLAGNLYTEDSHSVEAPSGNLVLKCYFTIPPELIPERTIVSRDFPCNTFLGPAIKSHSVANRGGQAILTCEVKKPTF